MQMNEDGVVSPVNNLTERFRAALDDALSQQWLETSYDAHSA